jgi:hypothetical protein
MNGANGCVASPISTATSVASTPRRCVISNCGRHGPRSTSAPPDGADQDAARLVTIHAGTAGETDQAR